MYSDDYFSPYGKERCRLPTNAGLVLCIAFQSLFYLADDPKICPETLKEEIVTFAHHCLCEEHARSSANVRSVAGRLVLAVERWRCRRVFMDEPGGGMPSTPEERLSTSRLSQFFLAMPRRAPGRRPKFRSRFDEPGFDTDSWHLPQRNDRRVRETSSSQRLRQAAEASASVVQRSTVCQQTSARSSQYQHFKARAKSAIGNTFNQKLSSRGLSGIESWDSVTIPNQSPTNVTLC